MKCPVCKDSDLAMADRQGIEIDYCPSCRGVWLDRGELDKIIERTSADAPPPSGGPAPREARDSRNYGDSRDSRDHGDSRDYGYPRKKRKSLLADLLDF